MMSNIEHIPIDSIRVVNPRRRNRKRFASIVENIRRVGLKRPITVVRQEGSEAFNLVCGQGRLEAVAQLGGVTIPAIVIEASKARAFLMSLVENVARKRTVSSALAREVRRLVDSGLTSTAIAKRLGLQSAFVNGVCRLLAAGKKSLIARVEAGVLPLTIAMELSNPSRKGRDIETELNIQRDERSSRAGPESRAEFIRADHERRTGRHHQFVLRAERAEKRLAAISEAMHSLARDASLVRLLQRQGLDGMPAFLANRFRRGDGQGNKARV